MTDDQHTQLTESLAPLPASGRVFRGSRRVRLGDADIAGRCRLDAIARYLQDVSNDDTRDAGLLDDVAWVVRRTIIDVERMPRIGETLDLATFCGGIGSRWAERRVVVTGDGGGAVDAATLWVHIDMTTQAPRKLPDQFHELFAEAAGGRTVSSRLLLGRPPDGDAGAGAESFAWHLRTTDFDVLGHVNNAAYWEIVEEAVGLHRIARPDVGLRRYRAVLEFQRPIETGEAIEVRTMTDGEGLRLWVVQAGGEAATHSAAAVLPR